MILNTNNEKILEFFLKEPLKGFQVRELIRLTKLGNPTVVRGIKKLLDLKLIHKRKGRVYPYYEANCDSSLFKKLKLFYSLVSLEKLIQEVIRKTKPNCIVLFGSCAKGEDTEKSDLDLFVQAEREKIETKKIEKRLNRKINFLFEPTIKNLNKELMNNLSNGIVVYGFLEAVK